MLAMLGMAVCASFVSFWPYNLTPSLKHYTMGLSTPKSATAFVNSLKMAAGTAVVRHRARLRRRLPAREDAGHRRRLRPLVRLLAMLPMAVPGLVLGLGYIFFFNAPAQPAERPLRHHGAAGRSARSCTSTRPAHLTAVTALKQLDAEFEAVSASLKVPFYKTFGRVTVPICMPAILDIARYLFVNAMTTISAVIFLYSPDTKLASIAILNMDEAGDTGAAAAMAMLIAARLDRRHAALHGARRAGSTGARRPGRSATSH